MLCKNDVSRYTRRVVLLHLPIFIWTKTLKPLKVNESDYNPFVYEMGCIKNESGIINLKFLKSDITKIKEHNGQQVTALELSESKNFV